MSIIDLQTPFEVLCCYIIRMMDKEVASPFVVVYLHSMTSNKNHVSYSILRELYQTLDYRYKKNLHALYIVHPTLWSRVSLSRSQAVISSASSRPASRVIAKLIVEHLWSWS